MSCARTRIVLVTTALMLTAVSTARAQHSHASTAADARKHAWCSTHGVSHVLNLAGHTELVYERLARRREDGAEVRRPQPAPSMHAGLEAHYRFTRQLSFDAEVDFEYHPDEEPGSASVLQAQLTYAFNPALRMHGGVLIVPMGIVNMMHERALHPGTTLPHTEQVVIPAVWREPGLGVAGDIAGLTFSAYVINGLRAVGEGAEDGVGLAPDGLHGAREDGGVSLPRRAAAVGRIELARRIPGLSIGTSMYYGDAGFESPDGDGDVAVPTTIWEGHAQYRMHGFDVAALYASARIGSAAAVNAARSLPAGQSIGERLSGYYLQGGYNLLESARTGQRLMPYVRYERVNTQQRVPTGYAADAEHDQTLVVLGGQWRPTTRLAFEADHQWRYNRGASGVNRFNVALALLF